ncbi:MAG: DNA-binding transcriptional MerR regulator [Flavobacteriales bacterium]|jgi:DNA-binding transcriptional MerR regulator
MIEQDDNNSSQFPIRELSARTQVNTVTLRAWERRYGLLKPKRTAKGHRLYSEADVKTIERVLALVARGVPLNKVKPLLLKDAPVTEANQDTEDWSNTIAELVTAIELLSASKVQHLVQQAFANYPAPICREHLIEPVFATLSQREDHGASVGFAESELLRYAAFRLNAKVPNKKNRVSVILITGSKTPLWVLVLVALELTDTAFSVQLMQRPFNVAACIDIANRLRDSYVVFYQDGIWKDKEKELVTKAFSNNERLFMCGTAPMLIQLGNTDRVFTHVKECINSLLKLSHQSE